MGRCSFTLLSTFQKDQLWKFDADFKTQANQKIGLKMTKLKEGAAEITIYIEPKISDDTKVTFIKYVHDHIKVKASNIIRLRHYVCPHCDTPVADHKTVLKKIEAGKKDILCLDCEKRILLWDIIEEKFASEQMQQQVNKLEKQAQSSIDNESKRIDFGWSCFCIYTRGKKMVKRFSGLKINARQNTGFHKLIQSCL